MSQIKSKKSFSWLKLTLWSLLAVFVLTIGIVTLLPTTVSSSWGQKKIISFVNNKIPGKVSIANFKISWFGNQYAQNLKLYDQNGNEICSIDELNTETSLLDLIMKKLKKTEIATPKLNITIDAEGDTNLLQALTSTNAVSTKSPASKKKKTNNKQWALNEMELKQGQITLVYQDDYAISFEKINANLKLSPKKDTISLQVSSLSTLNDSQGEITANCSYKKGKNSFLFKKKNQCRLPKGAEANISITTKNLPLKGVDQLLSIIKPNLNLPLSEIIGENLNLVLNSNVTSKNLDLEFSSKSKNLTINLSGTTLDGQFNLKAPGKVDFTLSPTFINKFNFVNLEQSIPILIQLNQATIPLTPNFDLKSTIIDLSLNTKQLTFSSEAENLKEIVAQNILFELKGPITQMQYLAKAKLDQTDEESLFFKLLEGTSLQINSKGNLSLFEKKTIIQNASVSLDNTFLQLQIPKMTIDNNKISFDNAINGEYSLTKNILKSYLTEANVELVKTTIPIKMYLEPFVVQFNKALSTPIKIQLSSETFTVAATTINDSSLYLDINSSPNNASIEFSSQLLHSNSVKNGSVVCSGNITNFLDKKKLKLKNANLKATLKTENIPTELIESYLGTNNSLTPRIGKFFHFAAQINCPTITKLNGDVALNMQSDLLNIDSKMKLSNNVLLIEKSQPTTIDWQLKSLKAIRPSIEENKISLQQPSLINAKLTQLWLPIKSITDMSFEGTIQSESIIIASDQEKHATDIRKFFASIKSQESIDSLNLKLTGQLNQPTDVQQTMPSKTPGFDITCLVDNLLNEEQKIDFSSASINTKATITQLPVQNIIYLLVPNSFMQEQLFAILGEKFSLEIDTNLQNMNGQIDANLMASNSNANIKSAIQNKNFILTSPLTAELIITPELGKALKHLNPMLSAPVSSEEPVELNIDAKGFNIPLFPFDKSNFNVGQARLDIGKMTLKNEGILASVINFCHSNSEKARAQKEEIQAWFTPLMAQCDSGVASYERVDALLDDIHVASWGNFDFVQDRCNMVIGITADSLREYFNIKNISDNYVLQIPIKGSINKPKLDTQTALIKLGTLESRQMGGAGFIFGEIIDTITSKAKNETPVPPPLVQPFPWETEQFKMKEEEPEQEETKEAPHSLFDALFN